MKVKKYSIKESTVEVIKNRNEGLLSAHGVPNMFSEDVLITIPKGFTYMSEVFTDLPTSCILNKGVTGCGGTTLAIQSSRKYVIAVPNISMIKNKLESTDNMFGLYGGVSIKSLDEYIRRGGNKIMVTYDSLYKVSELLGDKVKDWYILIDEEHTILMSGDYRNKAVNSVLNQYKKYKDFTFLSATPIHNEYRLESMKHIEKVEIQWGASFEGVVNKISSVDPLKDIAFKCVEALTSSIDKNPNKYIFLNSLTDIKIVIDSIRSILKRKEINLADNISIYCADTSRNQSFFKVKMKGEFEISIVNERNRRINFLTATAFEGADIFDENGESIVVMTSKGYTALSIFTTLPQIFGRIRNTKHNKNVYVYYYYDKEKKENSEDVFSSVESFKKHLDKVTRISKAYVKTFDSLDIEDRNEYAKSIDYDTLFLDIEEIDDKVSKLFVNESLALAKMNSYKTLMTTFKVMDRVAKANITRSVTYEYVPKKSEYTKERIQHIKAKSGTNFKETVKLYCKLIKEKVSIESANMDDVLPITSSDKMSANGVLNRYEEVIIELKDIEGLHYDLSKWYESISETGFIQANYSKTNIIAEYTSKNESMNQRDKVRALLRLNDGVLYPLKQLKHNIQRTYNRLGIDKTAKATDVESYYKAKLVKRMVSCKRVKGYTIIT